MAVDASRTRSVGAFTETCELQMSNRNFKLFFPMVLFLKRLPVINILSPLSYLLHCLPPFNRFLLPLPSSCITEASRELLAESQLSLLSQSDGPGHTSGNPWQGSPLPRLLRHPPNPPLWSWLDQDLSLAFTPPEKTKPIANQNTKERAVFHLRAEQRLHMLLLKSFSALDWHTAFIDYHPISDSFNDLPLNPCSGVYFKMTHWDGSVSAVSTFPAQFAAHPVTGAE